MVADKCPFVMTHAKSRLALMGEAKKSFMSSLWNVCVNMSNMILVSLRLINVVVIYVVNQFVVVELLYRGIVFFFFVYGCFKL